MARAVVANKVCSRICASSVDSNGAPSFLADSNGCQFYRAGAGEEVARPNNTRIDLMSAEVNDAWVPETLLAVVLLMNRRRGSIEDKGKRVPGNN